MPEPASDHQPKRGRPPVMGEPSIEIRASVGVTLHRQLRDVAQRERTEMTDVIREALREFVAKKLTPQNARP